MSSFWKSEQSRKVPCKSPAKVEAHDGGPREHSHRWEVAKVAKWYTETFLHSFMINTDEYCAVYLDVGIMLNVEDGDDVDGDEGAADDVHGHDQAVQVPEAG